MTRLVTIDNGGTLTDICVIDGDDIRYTKTLTTPFDLSRCVFDDLARAAEMVGEARGLPGLLQTTDYLRYSTTQGTNALVQRQGPRLGLLTADADLPGLLGGGGDRQELLDVLVGDRHATISLAADDDELSDRLVGVVNQLSGRGANRLVVSIGGEDGAASERRLKGLLLRLYPRHLLGAIPLLFSWELAADGDDVRRTWSSLLNGFIHQSMERFLFNTEDRLREHRTRRPMQIFRNDGGSSRVAKSAAIRTYSSGPRGGLEGTRALAGHYGYDHVLMIDVGGTTTDVGSVRDGRVSVDRRADLAGVPTSFEMAAITSRGIGGSSIFRVVDGTLRLGPDSVGSAPGPACFGLGGTEATITDVQLLLGVLDPATYLDGTMTLDVEAARRVVTASVAEPLGVALDDALAAMEEAFVAALAGALVDKGVVEGTVVAAFGGAGPLLIGAAARRAGVRRVVIPRTAAVFSAVGMGFSDLTQHYEQPLGGRDSLEAAAGDLRARAARDMFAEGLTLDDCELRFRLLVERDGAGGAGPTHELIDLRDVHDAGGRVPDGARASLELVAVATLPHARLPDGAEASPSAANAGGARAVAGSDLPVYELVTQEPGAGGNGPAVVEGPYFTMRVPDGWTFAITAAGDLLLSDQRSE